MDFEPEAAAVVIFHHLTSNKMYRLTETLVINTAIRYNLLCLITDGADRRTVTKAHNTHYAPPHCLSVLYWLGSFIGHQTK